MKLYRYRLGIDSIIEEVVDVQLIDDRLYLDEGDDFLKRICHESDINSGQLVMDWEYGWLCYNESQTTEDIRCDLTRILKNNIRHLRKQELELSARIARYECDINMLGECEIEKEDC
jgi:hypothetical protein